MSEQEPAYEAKGEEDGIFCQNCSPFVRKLGYYLTFLIGIVVFVVGILTLIEAAVYPLIIGSVIIVLSPLWIKSPAGLCRDLKNPVRLTSCILFFAFLIGTIVSNFLFKNSDGEFITWILGVCLAASGIWYFLSYFENGQKACVACIKACCGKSEESSGQTAESA